MENLSTEVGQKMRSAVKAKLIELGTGGKSGYIDDELPDYVMIMVANKRSKQQMISDLRLFLGSQTDVFVTWLYEVLQKLQEVTLPTIGAPKKRKNSSKESSTSCKRERKDKRSDKGSLRKSVVQSSKDIKLITDVFADEVLEKAKKTFDIQASAVVKDKEQDPSAPKDETDDFDIPTISEISHKDTTSTNESRQKEFDELAEIQKKIYTAKKQLKILEDEESEDGDLLNIKVDGEDFEDTNYDVSKEKGEKGSKPKSPIVYDKHEKNMRSRIIAISQNKSTAGSSETLSCKKHKASTFIGKAKHDEEKHSEPREKHAKVKESSENSRELSRGKRSFESSNQQRRLASELHIAPFRKNKMEMNKDEKMINGEVYNREDRNKTPSLERNKSYDSPEKVPHHRIGSHVIIASRKPEVNENEVDDQKDKPVNSIIKIKPRPSISPSKQACKNLLMRAIAEAQRSTVCVKPKKEISTRKESLESTPIRDTNPLSKSYHSPVNRNALLRPTAENLVIELNPGTLNKLDMTETEEDFTPEREQPNEEEEYEVIYMPEHIDYGDIDDEEGVIDITSDDAKENNTQFVVTLDDNHLYKTRRLPQANGIDVRNKLCKLNNKSQEKVPVRSRLTFSKEDSQSDPSKKSDFSKTSKKTKFNNPFAVQNDWVKNNSDPESSFWARSNSRHSFKGDLHSNRNKSLSRSTEDVSTTPPLPVYKKNNNQTTGGDIKSNKRKRELIVYDEPKSPKQMKRSSKNSDSDTMAEEKHRVSTKNIESKKYDNIPSLSSVAIDTKIMKTKSRERCRFYPNCTHDSCEFYHPIMPCKSFPNCKFADKCLYEHPKCKFDQTCNRTGCNYQHSGVLGTPSSAPPLSSHVVPVQNYKSISASSAPSMCKFFPNCSKPACTFFHPKMCRFGRNCINKLECSFYHHDVVGSKFKWVASIA